MAHSTPSQATPSGLIFCYLSVLSFQTRPLISTRAFLVTRIGLLSTRPSPTSLKFRISRMAQAPDAPQQEQIQALAAPQDAGQPAEPAGQPANLRYLFSPFLFLSCFAVGCCHVGLTLLVSVERQFFHVYVSPFGL